MHVFVIHEIINHFSESTCFYATLDEDEVSDDGDMWEQREHELMGYNVAEEQEGDVNCFL